MGNYDVVNPVESVLRRRRRLRLILAIIAIVLIYMACRAADAEGALAGALTPNTLDQPVSVLNAVGLTSPTRCP